ncbi:hypothetical protein PEC106568_07170 [Pectobacterium carotovorum subsp. carotovorum]|nr:hypothetical protein PEC106568_07170 [Pectobacterium carotovorum subsp. carotovorum]
MTHQIPVYQTAELLRLEREIAEHEQDIARKNEQRREIINRYSMNKSNGWADDIVRLAVPSLSEQRKLRGGD